VRVCLRSSERAIEIEIKAHDRSLLVKPSADALQDFNFMNNFMRATPRKLIVHVQIDEIRHWAQIGTLFRINGLKGDFHDFLFSPVLGGEFKRSVS